MRALVRALSLFGVLAALALILAGCGPSNERSPGVLASALAGTSDVELTYEIDGTLEQEPPGFGEDLRALVLQRLGAAQIGADVSEEGRRIHIVVDETLAPRVDELVTWTGTLLLLEPDPGYVLTPRDGDSSLASAADPTSGERWLEGPRADVLRAIETSPTLREHRILAEPIWTTADGQKPAKWRTRVVRAIAIGELGEGALVGWGEGPTLRVRGTKGSAEESVIEGAERHQQPPILARGRVSLGKPTFDGHALYAGFGEGAAAYARAQNERRLLSTARLPPLRRAGAVGMPPNHGLPLACLVAPLTLSLAWLVFVRRFDRAHPEPMWLVGVTFFLGAFATLPAGIAEQLFARASPWLDPNLVTFGGQSFALPLAIVVYTVVVGLSEEGSKRLAASFAVGRPEFDEPVDGIVYGIVASLGFAAAENIRYFALGRMSAPLVIARCFMSVPAHMFFGALWGYGLGAKLVEPKTRPWIWLLLAATSHGLFDALLSTEGASILAVVLNVGLASLFVVLVRRALRHGVVTKEMLAIRPEQRVLFRVGRPTLFWLSAALLHLFAFGIFLLGAYYQLARHRPSATFVVGSSVMLALLAVAALGVSATLPLDIAIDAYGITFAGAARSWRKIRGFSVDAHHVTLDCEAGPILLGPTSPDGVAAIAAELTARLGDRDPKQRLYTLESG